MAQKLDVDYQDAYGNHMRFSTLVRSFDIATGLERTITAAQLALACEELNRVLSPLLKGGRFVYSSRFVLAYTGHGSPPDREPDQTADKHEGATFLFEVAHSDTSARAHSSWSVPLKTFDETKLVPGGDQVDVSDPDVAAFITTMLEGAESTFLWRFCDSRNWYPVDLLDAKEAWW